MLCPAPCVARASATQLVVSAGSTSISARVQLLPCSELPVICTAKGDVSRGMIFAAFPVLCDRQVCGDASVTDREIRGL